MKRQVYVLTLKPAAIRTVSRPASVRTQQIVQAESETEARRVAAKECGEEGVSPWLDGGVEIEVLKSGGRKSKVLKTETRVFL